jgi:nucleotide-binding universal stress UspA family protein
MKNILVAYDGGRPAKRALEQGIELAERFDASLAVVSVVPVHRGRSRIDPWDDKAVHDRQLAEARAIVSRHGVGAELFEPFGDPGKEIMKLAETGHYDTIVVGSRGSGVATRLLGGSVSMQLASNAHATVVVTR